MANKAAKSPNKVGTTSAAVPPAPSTSTSETSSIPSCPICLENLDEVKFFIGFRLKDG